MQSTLGEYQETQTQEAFSLQNSKLLKVELNQITIQSKLGAMVAYQGDVRFEHAGLGRGEPLPQEADDGRGDAAHEDRGHAVRSSSPTSRRTST